MRHGWLAISDKQTGERTLAEQMLGVTQALAECRGKTIADFGCAEGLIAREFALVGAKSVHCIDSVVGHIEVARQECAGLKITFELCDLNKVASCEARYDIVLALGVAHKLRDPEKFIKFVAHSALKLAVIRLAGYAQGAVMRNKRATAIVNVEQTMRSEGFRLDEILDGPRSEAVHYYRPC